MLAQKEYEKKKKAYIKANLNNDNVYYNLTPIQQELIQKYYEQYAIVLFNRLTGSLRLEVSKSKAKKLAEMKGTGEWEFAGMRDMKVRGGEYCELGHALRYCYFAKNLDNGNMLRFGSTCVGDFFDLDSESLNALVNVKDVMFKEIKEMVAIKENNFMEEYISYDFTILGNVWKYMGIDSLERIPNLPLKNTMMEFLNAGLSVPNTLLTEIIKDSEPIKSNINEYLLYDDSKTIKEIYNCDIPLIKECYSMGIKSLVNAAKTGNYTVNNDLKQIHTYFGFSTKENLSKTMKVWLKRADRLSKAVDYFIKIGVDTPWKEIFSDVMRDNSVDKMTYLSVNMITVFDKQGEVSRVYGGGSKKLFAYYTNGTELQLEVLDDFDNIIEHLSKKSVIDYIKGLDNKIKEKRAEEKLKEDKEAQLLEYIKENIDKVKYEKIWGKDVVKDIVINKGLTFKRMSDKQAKFVERYYTEMQGIDQRENEIGKMSKTLSEQNNVYMLKEKPEVIAKIQRLQNEVYDVIPQKTKDIMSSILKYQKVSDRQLRHVNDAYLEFILGEKSNSLERPKTNESVIIENKKYKLNDRPDIKSRILEIKDSSNYMSLPQKTKDILESVLKYNSVSDKQLRYVDEAYRRIK